MASYANYALDYSTIGLCPLPVKNKQPLISGFNRWRGLSNQSIETLTKRFPEASLSILTRLSGLVVVDIDSKDADLVAWVIDECGYTPIIVKTKKGFHLYYSNSDGSIKGSIRQGNFPIDVKANGRSDYVVVPPSKGYDFQEVYLDKRPDGFLNRSHYDFLEILQKGLPEINGKGLNKILCSYVKQISNDNFRVCNNVNASKQKMKTNALHGALNDFREGNRNNLLWQHGMKLSARLSAQNGINIETYSELESLLHYKNEISCNPPLPYKEVSKILANIWDNYQIKNKNNFSESHETFMIDVLLTVAGIEEIIKNPKGMALLIWLKSHHENCNEFLLHVPKLKDLLGWSEHTTRQAKKFIIDNSFVTEVSPSNRFIGKSANFKFTSAADTMCYRNHPIPCSNDNNSN